MHACICTSLQKKIQRAIVAIVVLGAVERVQNGLEGHGLRRREEAVLLVPTPLRHGRGGQEDTGGELSGPLRQQRDE